MVNAHFKCSCGKKAVLKPYTKGTSMMSTWLFQVQYCPQAKVEIWSDRILFSLVGSCSAS